MDMEKIVEQLKQDPAKLAQLAAKLKETAKPEEIAKLLKEHKIDIEPDKIGELAKKLTAAGSDLLKNVEGKDLLEKGEGLLKDLLGGKK